jgi:ABC-type uncharacterized transport system substrate-binding protein
MPRHRLGLCILLALGLLWSPLAVKAQPAGQVSQVGLLGLGSDQTWRTSWHPFLEAMRERLDREGRNLVMQPAFAAGKAERLPALVAELVRVPVDVIVTTGTRETVAAKQAPAALPIVMLRVSDPVVQGLVASRARPGGTSPG